jgi:hypothetical protein
MGERGGQLCLALEALEQRGIAAERFGHHLDGDFAAQTGVLGPVDLGHATGPQESNYLVGSNPGRGR